MPAVRALTRSCSPHPQGWSQAAHRVDDGHALHPAPAGMVPVRIGGSAVRSPAPRARARARARGDGPDVVSAGMMATCCSPHPREWSTCRARALPEPSAPRTRQDGPVTACEDVAVGELLPAPCRDGPRMPVHAGNLEAARRTRGDGPPLFWFGVVAAACSPHPGDGPGAGIPDGHHRDPRTRGDDPGYDQSMMRMVSCSPHPRGWPLPRGAVRFVAGLLPAPARMVPSRLRRALCRGSAPCTRGDGPRAATISVASSSCSPHPRGWSRHDLPASAGRELLPAPAGMVPRRTSARGACASAPRTRGDGPNPIVGPMSGRDCSPHPRGWPPA